MTAGEQRNAARSYKYDEATDRFVPSAYGPRRRSRWDTTVAYWTGASAGLLLGIVLGWLVTFSVMR